jgi:hypothetical protein
MDRMLAAGKASEIEAAPHLLVSGMSGDVLNPTTTIRKRMKVVRGAAVLGPVKEVVAPRAEMKAAVEERNPGAATVALLAAPFAC